MIERLKPRSLSAKMVAMMLLSLFCALMVFVLVNGIGSIIVGHYYMSSKSISTRRAEIYSKFSLYVNENSLRGDDSERIAAWDEYGDYVTIFVYKDNSAAVNRPPEAKAEPFINSVQQYNGAYGKLYPLRFADGIYHIAINDNTRAREIMLNNVTAIVAAAVTLVLVMLAYISRLTSRIIHLSSEAVAIGAGDLDADISTEGEDELSMLAREMDNMRNSVIERMGNERRAWEANNELITAISHDIRTPMTTLIGYLGLLNDGNFEDLEKSRQFSAAAYDKAMDLKDLTDELFKYFLVFGKSVLELNMEDFDGRLLIEQLLGEAEFELRDMGFNVQRIDPDGGECMVSVDAMYLKRVMDNMVSNVKKYADKNMPVVMLTELHEKELTVCLSNVIARSMNRVESTKIGLRTCVKIMEHMNGSFATRSDESHFSAEFSLPIK